MGARGVDELELRHPQDHDRDALERGDRLGDAIGRRENSGPSSRTSAMRSSPATGSPGSGSRATPVARDTLYGSQKTPATTMPITTAAFLKMYQNPRYLQR